MLFFHFSFIALLLGFQEFSFLSVYPIQYAKLSSQTNKCDTSMKNTFSLEKNANKAFDLKLLFEWLLTWFDLFIMIKESEIPCRHLTKASHMGSLHLQTNTRYLEGYYDYALLEHKALFIMSTSVNWNVIFAHQEVETTFSTQPF